MGRERQGRIVAKKYDLITELYAEGIKEVTETEEQWLQFLNSACRNFRLPFDEQLLATELQALWNEKQADKPKQNQSELKRWQKRYDELTALIRGLYENLVSGLLPERQYKQLMKQYDEEQAELETKIEEMKKSLAEEKVNTVDIKHFISLIRKCKEPTEISDLMFHELIDKIVVYEAEGVGKARTQKVDIYFNYVGQVDIAYTEEELAEIKVQEE